MYINHAIQADLTEAYAVTRLVNPLFQKFCLLPICENMPIEEALQLFQCFEVLKQDAGDVIYETGTASDKTIRLIH